MENITKGKDLFGEEVALMSKGDSVYLVHPNIKDEEGNSKVTIIPKSLFVEFTKKLS